MKNKIVKREGGKYTVVCQVCKKCWKIDAIDDGLSHCGKPVLYFLDEILTGDLTKKNSVIKW